jgi:tRNA (guanine-N7-)-methyltransferase
MPRTTGANAGRHANLIKYSALTQSLVSCYSKIFPGQTAPSEAFTMAGTANKRQKRVEYKSAREGGGTNELPKKKFYRQRAHANVFSDHNLV